MRRCPHLFVLIAAYAIPAAAHDIPNARIDRSIQVTARQAKLSIEYEVGLSELILTQDLRALIGSLPGADRREWFEQYGRVTGPLNAKGLLISVDGRPLVVRSSGFDLRVEDHVRYTFHFEADLPTRGRLAIHDMNYASGEGMSRLAIRGDSGVTIRGDDLPRDVALIPYQPIWQLTDAEEQRTRGLEVDFEPKIEGATRSPDAPASAAQPVPRSTPAAEGLSRLLDKSTASGLGLWLMALTLGAAHAIQPGHGKSLVAAASIGDRGDWRRGLFLALVITTAHMGGVLAVTATLWLTQSARYPDINRGLAQSAGFAIAATGLWRLGRHLGGYGEHGEEAERRPNDLRIPALIGLGLASGFVPCWDAIVLVLLAEAVGRLALGLALLTAFSLGMAGVLVAVGMMASQLRGFIQSRDSDGTWVRRLGLLSASTITLIGLYLFV